MFAREVSHVGDVRVLFPVAVLHLLMTGKCCQITPDTNTQLAINAHIHANIQTQIHRHIASNHYVQVIGIRGVATGEGVYRVYIPSQNQSK